jgi:hypothetical protein
LGGVTQVFLQQLARRSGTFATLARNTQAFTQLSNRIGAIIDSSFDLAVSNAFAQTDVHGDPQKRAVINQQSNANGNENPCQQ